MSLYKDEINCFMPLMNSEFEAGNCKDYIAHITDDNMRNVMFAEYCYYTGDTNRALSILAHYLDSENLGFRMTAYLVSIFANITLGKNEETKKLFFTLRELYQESENRYKKEQRVLFEYIQVAVQVLTHMHVELEYTLLDDLKSKDLPVGLKLFLCYIFSHGLYLRSHYYESLGIVNTALFMAGDSYPLPRIYLLMVLCMDQIALRNTKEAKTVFLKAYHLAKQDNLLACFVEHGSMVGGTLDVCLKEYCLEDYEKVMEKVEVFFPSWRKLHNMLTNETITAMLTPMEFTISLLASRGWKNKEIAEWLNISPHTVKHYLDHSYQKLNVSGRKELKDYMIR